jgi:hypothetical protein
MLLAEVTQAWEVAAAAEATRIAVVIAVETSAQEATVAWDSTTLRVKDAKDEAALAEREALERVPTWEHFEELTLLQTQGFELCHAIVSPPWVRNHLSEGMWLATLCHTKMARELATLWVVVSFAAKSALGRSPNDIFCKEVVGELVAEF